MYGKSCLIVHCGLLDDFFDFNFSHGMHDSFLEYCIDILLDPMGIFNNEGISILAFQQRNQ